MILDNLDNEYGAHIHRRWYHSLKSGSNSVFAGTIINLISVIKSGTLEEFYARKLDDLRWKEDFVLVGTSLLWSWIPLVVNIITLPVAPFITFLSGVMLLKAMWTPQYYAANGKHSAEKILSYLVKALGIMIGGTILMTLSATVDVIRALPVVGHLLRIIYKLLDGQYNKPIPDNKNGGVGGVGGAAGALLESINSSDQQNTCGRYLLVRASRIERFFSHYIYNGFNFIFFSYSEPVKTPAIKSEDNELQQLSNVYIKFKDALSDLSLGCDSMSTNDILQLSDFLSALHTIYQYQTERSQTYLFNSHSTLMPGRVSALEFIRQIQATEFLRTIQESFVKCAETESVEKIKSLINELEKINLHSRHAIPMSACC